MSSNSSQAFQSRNLAHSINEQVKISFLAVTGATSNGEGTADSGDEPKLQSQNQGRHRTSRRKFTLKFRSTKHQS